MNFFLIQRNIELSHWFFLFGIMLVWRLTLYLKVEPLAHSFFNLHHYTGTAYLTAIIDWYSRKIVGWRLADTLETNHVLEAVRDAVERYGTPTILNSDQGSQFTSNEYRTLLKEYHITQSMDGRKRWADNIMVERWFRSLKQEEIYINEYQTPRELRHAFHVKAGVSGFLLSLYVPSLCLGMIFPEQFSVNFLMSFLTGPPVGT